MSKRVLVATGITIGLAVAGAVDAFIIGNLPAAGWASLCAFIAAGNLMAREERPGSLQ